MGLPYLFKNFLIKYYYKKMLTNTHVYDNILETIGNTPMVELKNLETGLCRLFVKLENQNPGGSIKDRIALSMIKDAEDRGELKPGGTIIEATAGNTGIGLALVARMKGYKIILVIPDKMSQEKINHLRALGAKIIITRSDVEKGHPDYYQDLAKSIAKKLNAYFINQFENPANPLAHLNSTGPEIWTQMKFKLDAVVAGVGSSGTITGLSHFFKNIDPKIEMVLADPEGSVIAEYINKGSIDTKPGSWYVEGIGEDFIPPIADLHNVKKAYTISDKESFDTARELLQKEGILAGSSSGTLVAAALRYCREQTNPKRVVTFVCDSGNKYLSKMYNDYWLSDRGFTSRKKYGDLRDIISRRYKDKAVVFLKPEDSLNTAFARMKLYDISQLPVLRKDKVVGILDESDILFSVKRLKINFENPVEQAMSTNLIKITSHETIETLIKIFKKGYVAIVESESGEFYGIITQIDLINYLKQKKYDN